VDQRLNHAFWKSKKSTAGSESFLQRKETAFGHGGPMGVWSYVPHHNDEIAIAKYFVAQRQRSKGNISEQILSQKPN
jgi:hypothetical protein